MMTNNEECDDYNTLANKHLCLKICRKIRSPILVAKRMIHTLLYKSSL